MGNIFAREAYQSADQQRYSGDKMLIPINQQFTAVATPPLRIEIGHYRNTPQIIVLKTAKMSLIASAGRVVGEMGLEFGEPENELPIERLPELLQIIQVNPLRGACSVQPQNGISVDRVRPHALLSLADMGGMEIILMQVVL